MKSIKRAEDNRRKKLFMLRKFRKQIEEPTIVQTPVNLSHQYRYRKYNSTFIVKRDHDRGQIIDYLLANLFKVYLLLFDRNWIEAFLIIYGSVTIIDDFNELILIIKINDIYQSLSGQRAL